MLLKLYTESILLHTWACYRVSFQMYCIDKVHTVIFILFGVYYCVLKNIGDKLGQTTFSLWRMRGEKN